MNTLLNRLNAVTAMATSVIMALTAVIALVSFPTHKPTGRVDIRNVEVVAGRAAWHMDRRLQDFARVTFDLDADFSSLFDWNTKQVFLSLAADFPSKAHPHNQVVIWDRIVRRKQDAHVLLEGATNKYGFREVSKSFADINATTFTLKWNTMPHVGALAYGDEMRTSEIEVPKRVEGLEPERIYY